MKRLLPLLFLFIAAQSITSQDIQFYTNAKGDKHITGSFPIDYLKKDSLYSKWFLKSYDEFSMPTVDTSWKKRLKKEKMKELVKEEGGRVRLSKVGSLNLSQMLPTYKKIKSFE